ncbi:alpha-1-antiproteinase 2-like [Rhynchocyon petersi]
MPSSLSWCLLLLAALCCLVPRSLADSLQADAAQEADVPKHDHDHHQTAASHKIAPNLADFAFSLYHELAQKSNTTNIFFSPVSTAMAFSLLSMGAKSDTLTQILEGLKFNLSKLSEAEIHEGFHDLLHAFNQSHTELHLTAGNGLFIQENLKLVEAFLEHTKEAYYSEIFSVNFNDMEAAAKEINDYVQKGAQGKIVDLVKELDKDTRLALMNYVFFEGKWKKSFNENHTRNAVFHVDEMAGMIVPMMFRAGSFNLHRHEELSSWVLLLDYIGNATAIFIMPDSGKMQQLEDRLTKELLSEWLQHEHHMFADVYFPKFSVYGSYKLEEILGKLGITKVFSNDADLSGITETAPLKVSKAVHRAVMTIDESPGNLVYEPLPRMVLPVVEYNRPFLTIIYDKNTRSPLLVGRVMSPLHM